MKKLGDLLKGLLRSKVDKAREAVESITAPPESHEDWQQPVRGGDPLEAARLCWRCATCAWEGEFAEAEFRLSDPSLTPRCPECRGELRSQS